MHNAKHVMGDPMLPQYDGIREIMSREPVDLILTDFIFLGVFPLLLGPRSERPPIISVSVSPLVLSSVDASPFGPAITVEEKECNRKDFFLDCIYTMPDMLLRLSVDALEFPRSDMPRQIEFVAVLPRSSPAFRSPDWWNELDDSRPVVLVTQGTVANTDLNDLIGPTLAALSTDEVIVIAATGKENGSLAVPIPANLSPRVSPGRARASASRHRSRSLSRCAQPPVRFSKTRPMEQMRGDYSVSSRNMTP